MEEWDALARSLIAEGGAEREMPPDPQWAQPDSSIGAAHRYAATRASVEDARVPVPVAQRRPSHSDARLPLAVGRSLVVRLTEALGSDTRRRGGI